ncbi:hypothetical protein OKW43_007001 [Paraburkholderia sp. WC7.3g]|uniref:Prevent-host-death protein n=1 Tax=Paraburkholderia podalyriae TaxID=1938811 RepID=A0ABR7PMS1_9BURK|nr:hypothetical protein [Paraburkholderia podalyriae]MBC8747611.1 hypothetical protein [Paraburkholderia podalyriae]
MSPLDQRKDDGQAHQLKIAFVSLLVGTATRQETPGPEKDKFESLSIDDLIRKPVIQSEKHVSDSQTEP